MKYRRNIPYIGDEEINAVADVIDSGMIVRGKKVKEFEDRFKELTNKKYAVMIPNCTTALELALEVIANETNLKEPVIIPDYTFTATGNAVLNVGLKPLIFDVKKDTYNLETDGTEKNIIIPVHCFGNPCKIDLEESNFIIEDAACAVGSEGIGYGDIQCFSLHATKIITTGIGGILTTDNRDWAETILRLCQADKPYFNKLAYNYQISDINAAIGIEQLKKLPYILKQRRMLAKRYNDFFESYDDIIVQKTKGSNYQSYVIMVDSLIRDNIIQHLINADIEACIGTYSLSLLSYFNQKGNCPIGNSLYKEQICLPLYPQMTEEDQDYIIENVKECI